MSTLGALNRAIAGCRSDVHTDLLTFVSTFAGRPLQSFTPLAAT